MPTGGYRHAATAFAASSAVLMSGTMMPYAPRSSAFMMVAGSLHGTRTTGTVSTRRLPTRRLDNLNEGTQSSPVPRLLLALLLTLALITPATAAPEGQLTYALHISLATRWLDPGDLEGLITPFVVFYALHDAVVKSMPGTMIAPSLAESWTVSKDGTVVDFALRKGV